MSDVSLVQLLELLGVSDMTEFSSYEEMRAEPGFQETVNPALARPVRVLGPYRVKPLIPCGLSTCRHKNGFGLLVLTESGAKTNIGHCCGERLFGSEWHALHRNAQRSTDVRRDLEAVLHTKRRMPEFNARVTALCDAEFGAKWLNQTLDRFAAKYPRTVMDQLYERAKRGDADVYAERQITREEADLRDIMADGRKPSRARNDADDEDEDDKDSLVQQFVRERQGALGGLTIFRDPIRDVVVGLRSTLEELHQTDLKAINVRRLGKLARSSRELDEVFLRIEELCAAGRQFFQPENLKLLRYLSFSVAERRKVEDVKLNFHR